MAWPWDKVLIQSEQGMWQQGLKHMRQGRFRLVVQALIHLVLLVRLVGRPMLKVRMLRLLVTYQQLGPLEAGIILLINLLIHRLIIQQGQQLLGPIVLQKKCIHHLQAIKLKLQMHMLQRQELIHKLMGMDLWQLAMVRQQRITIPYLQVIIIQLLGVALLLVQKIGQLVLNRLALVLMRKLMECNPLVLERIQRLVIMEWLQDQVQKLKLLMVQLLVYILRLTMVGQVLLLVRVQRVLESILQRMGFKLKQLVAMELLRDFIQQLLVLVLQQRVRMRRLKVIIVQQMVIYRILTKTHLVLLLMVLHQLWMKSGERHLVLIAVS